MTEISDSQISLLDEETKSTDFFDEEPEKLLALTSFLVRHSFKFFVICALISIGLTVSCFFFKVNIDYSLGAFRIRDHPVTENFDAMNTAVTNFGEVYKAYKDEKSGGKRDVEDLERIAERSTRKFSLHLLFKLKDDSMYDTIFNEQALVFAQQVTRDITSFDGYETYCWRNWRSDICYVPDSPLPFFFPTSIDPATSYPIYTEEIVGDISNSVETLLKLGLYQYTDPSFSVNNQKSDSLRIQFSFGTPLEGFDSSHDRFDEQAAIFTEFIHGLRPYLEQINENDAGVLVIHGGSIITSEEIMETITKDLAFAVIAIFVVFIIMIFHMKSVFMAICGYLEILISLPLSYFVYRGIFSIDYFGVLNGIGLFLILGIGVDDVFVFWNIFKTVKKKKTLPEAISYTYRHAAKATFITSFTTAAAFATNAFSLIPSLRLFGIYMTLLVVLNYVLVLTWFPSVIIFYETYWKKITKKVCTCCSKGSKTTPVKLTGCIKWENYATFIGKAKIFILVFFLILSVASMIAVTQLHTSNEIPQFFPKNHPIQIFMDWESEGWVSNGIAIYKDFDASDISFMGCDGVIGSGKYMDECDVCGGHGESCSTSTTESSTPVPTTSSTSSTSNIPTSSTSESTTSTKPSESTSESTKPSESSTSSSSSSSSVPTTSTKPSESSTSTTSSSSSTTISTKPSESSTSTTSSSSSTTISTTSSTSASSSTSSTSSTTETTSSTTSSTSASSSTSKSTTSSIPSTSSSRSSTSESTSSSSAPEPTTPTCSGIKDVCGVCNGDGTSCLGCDGEPFSQKVVDQCGVCGGDDSTCVGCDGIRGSGKKWDLCDVCGGTNECIDKPITVSGYSMYLVYGITTIDRTKTDINDPFNDDVGDPVYYEDFDPTRTEGHRFITSVYDDMMTREDIIITTKSHGCPLSAFEKSMKDKNRWPLSGKDYMREILSWIDGTGKKYRSHVGFSSMDPEEAIFLFVRQYYQLLVPNNISGSEFEEYYYKGVSYAEEKSKRSPNSVGPFLFVCGGFITPFTETTIINGIATSIIVSLAIALFSLIFFLGNFILPLFSVLIVFINIILILGFYWIFGWQLGAIEALSISILIGLSVDYIFHVADAYKDGMTEIRKGHHSTKEQRNLIVRYVLGKMGSAILGGATTTVFACLVLMTTTIVIFSKFGIIVSLSLSISLIMSLVLFPTLMLVFGPVGYCGDYLHGIKKCIYQAKQGKQQIINDHFEQELSNLSFLDTMKGVPLIISDEEEEPDF